MRTACSTARASGEAGTASDWPWPGRWPTPRGAGCAWSSRRPLPSSCSWSSRRHGAHRDCRALTVGRAPACRPLRSVTEMPSPDATIADELRPMTFPPGHRHRRAPGRDRAVPDLEPRPLGADPGVARVGRPRHGAVGRRVASTSPSSSASTWPRRWRPAGVLPAGLGPHHPRLLPLAPAPARRDVRRAPGLAARRRARSPSASSGSCSSTPCARCSPSRSPPPSSSPSTA